MRICIYAASSDRTDPAYREAARRPDELLAEAHGDTVQDLQVP